MRLVLFLILLLNAPAFAKTIMLIDLQERYLFPPVNPPPAEMRDALIRQTMELLRWGKENGYSVLVFEMAGEGPTIEPIRSFVESFERYFFYTKFQNGGFDNIDPIVTPDDLMQKWNSKHVIVAGLNAPFCVSSTLVGALQFPYCIATSADLLANFGLGGPRHPYHLAMPKGPSKHPESNYTCFGRIVEILESQVP